MKIIKILVALILTIPCLFIDFGSVLTETVSGAIPGSVINDLKFPKIWTWAIK